MADNSRKPPVSVALAMCPLDVCVSVLRLFFAGGPSAISRAIVSVVVDPFNRKPIWFAPHVSKKICVNSPTGADFNTAAAIPRVMDKRWVCASVSDGLPSFVLWRIGFAMRANGLKLKASAASMLSTRQVMHECGAEISALA